MCTRLKLTSCLLFCSIVLAPVSSALGGLTSPAAPHEKFNVAEQCLSFQRGCVPPLLGLFSQPRLYSGQVVQFSGYLSYTSGYRIYSSIEHACRTVYGASFLATGTVSPEITDALTQYAIVPVDVVAKIVDPTDARGLGVIGTMQLLELSTAKPAELWGWSPDASINQVIPLPQPTCK